MGLQFRFVTHKEEKELTRMFLKEGTPIPRIGEKILLFGDAFEVRKVWHVFSDAPEIYYEIHLETF